MGTIMPIYIANKLVDENPICVIINLCLTEERED
jgi:hypothetical protein